MKKAIVMLVAGIMLFTTSVCFALGDNENNNNNGNVNHNTAVSDNRNTNNNDNRNTNLNNQGQNQGQAQGQQQGQAQGQGQAQAAIAAQGQLQGQVANGSVETNVTGDTNKVYANSWPSLSSAEGVSSGTASSIFGSLGLTSTESYKKLIPQIQAIIAIDPEYLDIAEKKAIIKILVKKMTDANRTQRLLGVGPELTGKSLLNLFGILSWDSFWSEGQNPLQCKSDIKE